SKTAVTTAVKPKKLVAVLVEKSAKKDDNEELEIEEKKPVKILNSIVLRIT
ncbi:26082_t:CDS:1, partial [Gigaspora rosea]